jgi:glycosyltransferase involved in cell wall biosynthesis
VLDDITPMILTFNEEANIGRTLDKLTWAKRILVIDSGSTDGTFAIIARYPQAQVMHRAFDSFAGQCNFGLQQIASEWVLSLDADYVLDDALIKEITALAPPADVDGFRARFVYCVAGRSLRGSLYPDRTVLYRRAQARYRDDGHGHRVAIDGRVAALGAPIYHDDRKPLARWFAAQLRYAAVEADWLTGGKKPNPDLMDRLRLMIVPAPPLAFLYTLIVKRCLFDGWAGWFYALQRLCAEVLLALEILDRRLRRAAR